MVKNKGNWSEGSSVRNAKIQKSFDEFCTRPLFSFLDDGSLKSSERLAISAICRRPELRPLLLDVKFGVGELESCPFVIFPKRKIVIDRAILSDQILAAFHFYHLLEISVLHSCLGNSKTRMDLMAIALAAFRSTIEYFEEMIEVEQKVVWPSLEFWIQEAIVEVRECNDLGKSDLQVLHALSGKLDSLLPLQKNIIAKSHLKFTQGEIEEALQKVVPLYPLLRPLSKILTTGGDNRLSLNKANGLNAYGCSPRPRPWAITFSSCTASSISEHAYQEAEWLRQDLLANAWRGNLVERSEREHQLIRREIDDLLKLDCVPNAKVILTSSGTDAELHALYFAFGGSRLPIRNIVISSTEIGSGTVAAAGGCHFDKKTPLGMSVKKEEAIEGFPCDRVDVSVVELRHKNGTLRTLNELDLLVKNEVSDALSNGNRVLLHLLDCSKTGIGGPSFKLLRQLRKKHPSDIEVVVDAAQMRITRRTMHKFLQEGFMVILSGSKFFTGPPFSGALIVPHPLAIQVELMAPFPKGVRDYSTPFEFPSDWVGLTEEFYPTINFGLLLRWRAALWEMRAFYAVRPQDRWETLATFGSEIKKKIRENPDLELMEATPLDRGHSAGNFHWDELPSIFTFLVYRSQGNIRLPLSYEEARFAYQCINRDVTPLLPIFASDREYELMRKRCHIGQPVRVPRDGGEWVGALRVAAGARLVSGVQFDEGLGVTPAERLETEIRTAGVIFSKLSVILKYWDHLISFEFPGIENLPPSFCQF